LLNRLLELKKAAYAIFLFDWCKEEKKKEKLFFFFFTIDCILIQGYQESLSDEFDSILYDLRLLSANKLFYRCNRCLMREKNRSWWHPFVFVNWIHLSGLFSVGIHMFVCLWPSVCSSRWQWHCLVHFLFLNFWLTSYDFTSEWKFISMLCKLVSYKWLEMRGRRKEMS
jgi:hypothetical protein